MARALLLGCVAGVAAGLVFHQGAMWLLHVLTAEAGIGAAVFGTVPFPWSTTPMEPVRAPRVAQWSLTTAVTGGWLGLELYWRTTEEVERRERDLFLGFVLGGLVLTFVGALPVWLKDLPKILGRQRPLRPARSGPPQLRLRLGHRVAAAAHDAAPRRY